MIEQTPLVLIFLITKPVFLLLVVWIVIWRSRHQMTAEMLPYSPSTRKPEALLTSHADSPAIQSRAESRAEAPEADGHATLPAHLDARHDGTPG